MAALLCMLWLLGVHAEEAAADKVYVPGVDGVSFPTRTKYVTPATPTVLEHAHLQARVEYYAIINIDGTVEIKEVLACGTRKRGKNEYSKLSAEDCQPIDQAGRAAIQGWRYEPAMKDGTPVRSGFAITLSLVPSTAH